MDPGDMVIRQTCFACPSQWEITLDDGRVLYVRYRFGGLSTAWLHDDDRLSTSIDWAEIRDGMDGFMTTEEMLDLVDVNTGLINGPG